MRCYLRGFEPGGSRGELLLSCEYFIDPDSSSGNKKSGVLARVPTGPGPHGAYRMKLPPSSLIVLSLLGRGEALTHKEIAKLTGLPPRTVRYALQKLRESCLIREEWNFKDARQIRYRDNGANEQSPGGSDMKLWRSGTYRKSSFSGTQ
jgi:hypothetical protein